MKLEQTFRCYLITNKKNGKQYVGYTKYTLARRLSVHFAAAKGGSKYAIHAAIRKYGKTSFTIEELSICMTLDEARQQEISWIKSYNTFKGPGYNMSEGGETSAPPTKPYSLERRKKLSASTKRFWKSRDGKKKKHRLIERNQTLMKDKWINPTQAMMDHLQELGGRPKGSKNKLPYPDKRKPVEHEGVIYQNAAEAADKFGVVPRTIHRWCATQQNGWCHPWK